jgi:hypothetical protein
LVAKCYSFILIIMLSLVKIESMNESMNESVNATLQQPLDQFQHPADEAVLNKAL